MLWLLLAAPFALFLAFVLVLLVVEVRGRSATPPPLDSGPFHLRAWLLPERYDSAQLVQLVDGDGVGLATRRAGSGGSPYYLGGYDTVLRLEPDERRTLGIAQTHLHVGLEQPMMLTRDGRVLYMPVTPQVFPPLTPPRGMVAELSPLPDATHQPSIRFDLGFFQTQTYWFTMLDSARVGMVDDQTALSGKAQPWVAHAAGGPVAGPVVKPAVACGDVWIGWPSLGILAPPDKLYVLDRDSEQFTLRPELAGLAGTALRGTPQPARFAYSGGCLVTQSRSADALRLFGADGGTLKLRLFDPATQNPDGSARLVPPGGVLELAPWLVGGRYGARQRALRREGRRAPLSACGSLGGGCEILPIGDGRFALLDDAYQRVVVIGYDAGR
jgi:hypothetical protein